MKEVIGNTFQKTVRPKAGKIVPGQNDTLVLVVPQVPWHFSRCPCGVGAYDV